LIQKHAKIFIKIIEKMGGIMLPPLPPMLLRGIFIPYQFPIIAIIGNM
jgi:hypothetical protein